MAASCISVAVSAPGLQGVAARECKAVKQTGRVSLAFPSACVSALAAGLAPLSLFSGVGSRAERNAAIVARAADLEQEVESVEVAEPLPEGTKLYVGNLPWSCHSKQLAEVFQEAGNVELVEVIYDRDTEKSRGFAFVTMSTVEDAQKAIDRLNGYELDGRIIKVNFPASSRDGPRFGGDRPPRREFGMGGGGQNQENKLFVGNLAWGVDDVSLGELFSEYGQVVEAKVVYDRETGRSRGFGFVTMSSSSEVTYVISKLDGAEFDGRLLRVNLAGEKPPPREPREY